jgi:hypothetical protein
MRPASLRRRFPSTVPAAVVIATLLLVCAWVSIAIDAPPVSAAGDILSVTVDESLSLVGRPVIVTVGGQVSQSLVGGRLVISVRGPVAPAQVGQSKVDAMSVKQITQSLGTSLAGSGADTSTTLGPSASSTAQDLAAGKFNRTITIPGGSPSAPGAYLLSVEVLSGGRLVAGADAWMGKVADRETPLDVSFVLPVSLGIHRDWAGIFLDQVLEKATLPAESGVDTLRGLAPLADGLSQWRFTLALEPILLTQLRDMADGYVFADATGNQTNVDKNDLEAQNAAAAIAELSGLATRDSVEVVASPYAGADLGLLAAAGWRDGLEQIQMGKQELQSTLGLGAPLTGAYAPDLGLTGDSLAYYADASVDHIVVSSDLQASLAEAVAPGTVAVRVENGDSDRATLVFAASGLGAVMRAPWDANVFSAAIAADLASNARNALVIAPKDVFGLMPLQYVQRIGEILMSQSWIRTQKLQDLLSQHAPDSRPVLLVDSTPQSSGYIEGRLLDGVRRAHVPVSDLAAAADTTKTPVNQACQLLYVAESRWWSRQGVSPEEASTGLAYAMQAKAAAEEELGKVRFLKTGSPLAAEGEGTVRVAIDNATGYQVAAELRLAGEGLSFPEGERVPLELQPGRTDLRVRVIGEGGPQKIIGSLVVGTTVADEFAHTVSSLRLWTILPWILAVIGLLALAGGSLLMRRRLRKRGADETD